jgi:hypothetical protein
MKIFKLPDLGEGLPDAQIREWYVKEGDSVTMDQPLAAMETAKALVDIPSPYDGIIEKLFGAIEDTIQTGDPLIGFIDNTAATDIERKDTGTVVGNIEVSDMVITDNTFSTRSTTPHDAITPAARALARRRGIDLHKLSSRNEQVHIADLKVASKTPMALPEGFEPLSAVRRAMILSMKKSHEEIVPVTITDDVDIHAWYGKGDPDQAALTACKALKGMLSGRAAERTQKELLKLLAAEDPRAALRLMAATSVLSSVLPQVKALTRFETLVAIQTEQLFENDAEIRLAALLPDDAVIARDTAERLRLSNALKDRLIEAAGKEPRIVSWMSPREARRTVYKIGLRAFTDRIKLGWAASTRPSTTSQWRGLLALAETWTPPAFPLTGDEILAAGVPKGPMVGEVMREVEEWWIDNDFMDDKLAAVERLKAVTQGMCF